MGTRYASKRGRLDEELLPYKKPRNRSRSGAPSLTVLHQMVEEEEVRIRNNVNKESSNMLQVPQSPTLLTSDANPFPELPDAAVYDEYSGELDTTGDISGSDGDFLLRRHEKQPIQHEHNGPGHETSTSTMMIPRLPTQCVSRSAQPPDRPRQCSPPRAEELHTTVVCSPSKETSAKDRATKKDQIKENLEEIRRCLPRDPKTGRHVQLCVRDKENKKKEIFKEWGKRNGKDLTVGEQDYLTREWIKRGTLEKGEAWWEIVHELDLTDEAVEREMSVWRAVANGSVIEDYELWQGLTLENVEKCLRMAVANKISRIENRFKDFKRKIGPKGWSWVDEKKDAGNRQHITKEGRLVINEANINPSTGKLLSLDDANARRYQPPSLLLWNVARSLPQYSHEDIISTVEATITSSVPSPRLTDAETEQVASQARLEVDNLVRDGLVEPEDRDQTVQKHTQELAADTYSSRMSQTLESITIVAQGIHGGARRLIKDYGDIRPGAIGRILLHPTGALGDMMNNIVVKEILEAILDDDDLRQIAVEKLLARGRSPESREERTARWAENNSQMWNGTGTADEV